MSPLAIRVLLYAAALSVLGSFYATVALLGHGPQTAYGATMCLVAARALWLAHSLWPAEACVADLHRMSPSEVAEYLERFQAARTMLGDQQGPPDDLVEVATDYMDEQDVRLDFMRVLDNEDGMVWVVRAHTGRGVFVERPEVGETWVDFLLRQGWLPGG